MVNGFLTALKSLAGRLAFFVSLIILLPLAVLNRQMVELALNPFDILRQQPSLKLSLPLFMALFIAFAIGIMLGYALAAMRKTQTKPKAKAAKIATQSPTGEAFTRMVNKAPEKTRISAAQSDIADDAHIADEVEKT